MKIVINYKTSETSVWLNKEPLRQSLSFDPVHRANQLIFYVPSPKASRTVGLDGVWIGTGDEEPADEGSDILTSLGTFKATGKNDDR